MVLKKSFGYDTRSRLKILVMVVLVAAPVGVLPAQDSGETLLRSGIDAFGATNYDEAIRTFRDIILDSDHTGYQDEAYFWIAKSFIALGQHDDAEKNLEFFIAEFPESPYFAEALYQRGRLLFLRNQYDAAILALEDHIDQYPDSPFVANSYFWIGEALYGLGQFDRARQVFSIVVDQYPASFKVEAARYRISLIDLKEREEELLKLIKWSHEEYLQALEDFQRRERSYEQAIATYRRRVSELTSSDKDRTIADLKARVVELETESASYREQAEKLKSQLDRLLEAPFSGATGSSRETLLELKDELLELKSYYLEQLDTNE